VISQANPAAGRYPIAAAAMALMLAGTLLPTPLFELYHRLWNLTPADLSLVFAVYAGSLIPSLMFLGGLSDSIGRRRTILLAFALLALGSLAFAFADGLIWLIVARIIQGIGMGIGTGAAAAAIGEWMHESQRSRAGAVTVVAVSGGSAAGALLGGVLGQYGPNPLALPYFVHIGLLACGAIAVATVPSCPHLHPAGMSAVPRIPRAIRRPFLIASVESFIGWSTFAIFVSLVPSFLSRALDLHNLLVGAVVITAIQIGSVAASLAGAGLTNRTAIITAMLALGAGLWLLLIAIALRAEALVALASLIAGAGGGLAYLAGLNIVGAISPPEHRAETLSAFLVACYLGYSIPALCVGIAATRYGLGASFVGAAIVLGMIAIGVSAFSTDRNLGITPAG
jgi:predicted MFS family arabinose efflux permease